MRAAAWATFWWAKKLTSKLRRSISSEQDIISLIGATPAFEITISTPPKALEHRSKAAITSEERVTSQADHATRLPKRSAVAADSSESTLISVIKTCAPAAANAVAVAKPIPDAA